MVPMEAKDAQTLLVWVMENMSPEQCALAIQQAATKRASDVAWLARNDPNTSTYWMANALNDARRWEYLAKGSENSRVAIQTVNG